MSVEDVSIHTMSTTTASDVNTPTGRPRDTLSARVKLARWERGLSQRAAALRCGITFGELQSIENGADARGLDSKVEKIAEGLGYDRDWLMWGGPLDSGGRRTAWYGDPASLGEPTAA